MFRARRLARLGGLVAAVLTVAAVAAACSSGGSGGGSISVTEPWARASSITASAGAAYMVIENTGSAADALVGASSPAAKTVEVHETVAMGTAAPTAAGGMMGATPMPGASAAAGGMMGMQPIARLEIPAGGSVALKPGSYHIMLIDLNQELKVGETIEITLKFEKAGDVKVSAVVRES
jgi:periplasmic copper chaperone A